MIPLVVALGEYGKESWAGVETNPEVIKYFDETGHDYIDEDETPWCAAFMNWVMKKCNITTPNKLNARSFLDVGVPTSEPRIGDIVVFWRISPNTWQGHVGLFIRETKRMIFVLGGNQDSSVKILPYNKAQLLGYRRVE